MRDYKQEIKERLYQIRDQFQIYGATAYLADQHLALDFDNDYSDKALMRYYHRLGSGLVASEVTSEGKREHDQKVQDALGQSGVGTGAAQPKQPVLGLWTCAASALAIAKLQQRGNRAIHVPSLGRDYKLDLAEQIMECDVATDLRLKAACQKDEAMRTKAEKDLVTKFDQCWTHGRLNEALQYYQHQVDGYQELVDLVQVLVDNWQRPKPKRRR
jgi:hypothetical protein